MTFKPLTATKRNCPNCTCHNCAWRDNCEYCVGRQTTGCEFKIDGTDIERTNCIASDNENERKGL